MMQGLSTAGDTRWRNDQDSCGLDDKCSRMPVSSPPIERSQRHPSSGRFLDGTSVGRTRPRPDILAGVRPPPPSRPSMTISKRPIAIQCLFRRPKHRSVRWPARPGSGNAEHEESRHATSDFRATNRSSASVSWARPRREVIALRCCWRSTVLAAVQLVLGTIAIAQTDPVLACRGRNPTWFECSRDDDCVLTTNACGWPTEAVIRRFAKDAENCNRLVGTALSCATYDPAKVGRFEARCIASTCVSRRQPLPTARPPATPSN